MQYKPYSYQEQAIEHIKEHPEAAVFLDMGLGKTSITLTAIKDLMYDSFEITKVLIIAPLRVAKNTWPEEIAKWDHLNNLTYSVVVGSARERTEAMEKKADLYIINRENTQWLVQNFDFDFDMVVIDELSSFKNHNAQRFKALKKVRPKVKRVVGLTGTPAPNGYLDLWAEFFLLDMGMRLGRFYTHYRDAYFLPDQRSSQVIYSYKPAPKAEEMINDKIRDITIHIAADDYLKLPEFMLTEQVVHMDEKEERVYEDLKKDMVLELPEGEITIANAASLSGKLSQMANGAVYDDEKKPIRIHDHKLDALEDIIEAANGKPLMVAYWFKHDRQRISERLEKLHIPAVALDTQESIRDWNAGKIQVALIHPASAGHGLNLQYGGSTIVWFGMTWSLELYAQTNARLRRPGQSASSVMVIHIITDKTIDRQMLSALKSKDNTQEALLNAVKLNLAGG